MVVAGVGFVSLSNVAPATIVESSPPPNPPIQKNGIGMYRRSPSPMHRASSPPAVARSAPPCVWITPLGAPRLPDVNMTTRSSVGSTRASVSWRRASAARSAGSASDDQMWRRSGRRWCGATSAPTEVIAGMCSSSSSR